MRNECLLETALPLLALNHYVPTSTLVGMVGF